ncbi:MAG: YheT family hydrolase [Rhodothermales bacterium]
MPLIPSDVYIPPFPLRNRHLHTIYPALFRHIKTVAYNRERFDLPDGDFLDLDWSLNTDLAFDEAGAGNRADQLCIFLHGLEGSTDRSYIKGMVRSFNRNGWDAVACNFRGCSGESNRLLRSYHAGATEDLVAVIDHVLSRYKYSQIALVGFSLGGNLMLKYLGDYGATVPGEICGAVGVSVPCDLAASVDAMAAPSNGFYMKRFMRNLRAKMIAKEADFPGQIDISRLDQITTFQEFDNSYTAPLHGFANADAYWGASSCISGLRDIKIPTLILNAKDDPFLAPACFPVEAAQSNADLFLEMPLYGGHVGFVDKKKDGYYWSERRALDFFSHIFA